MLGQGHLHGRLWVLMLCAWLFIFIAFPKPEWLVSLGLLILHESDWTCFNFISWQDRQHHVPHSAHGQKLTARDIYRMVLQMWLQQNLSIVRLWGCTPPRPDPEISQPVKCRQCWAYKGPLGKHCMICGSAGLVGIGLSIHPSCPMSSRTLCSRKLTSRSFSILTRFARENQEKTRKRPEPTVSERSLLTLRLSKMPLSNLQTSMEPWS